MAPAPVVSPAPDTTVYPLDERLHAALAEARERGDQAAVDAATLALAIREHPHFRALVIRMQAIPIGPTARGLARTEKSALLGTPEKGTDLGRAHGLARLIVADLDVPDGEEAKAAAALALVLAEECHHPARGKRSAHA